jgi:nitrite reductase/ring-hydroxylating ferredoxin subunit
MDDEVEGEGWVRVIAVDNLPLERATRVEVDGAPVLTFRTAERVFAVANRCTHQGAPLDRGRIRTAGSEPTVTCPAHGSTFRLSDGAVIRSPATTPLTSFDILVKDGWVHLRPARRP